MRHSIKTVFLEDRSLPAGTFAALRTLFSGQWPRLALAGLMYVIKHSPVWITPIITAGIINAISTGGPDTLEHCLFFGGILAGLLLLNIPCNTAYVQLLNGSIRVMEAHTRMALIRRLQLLNFGFHDQARTGALQNKVLRDVESVGVMISQFINTILATLVGVVLALVWTLVTKPAMALFFLATVPLAVILMRSFRKPIAANTQHYRKALEGMSVRVTEMLTMLPITRAHAAEDFEIDRISTAMDQVARTGKSQDVFNGLFGATTWVTFQLFSLVSLLVSGVLALRGEIPIGDVILYQGFFMSIVSGVSAVVNVLPDLTKGANAIQSIGEVLRSPELERNQGKRLLPVLHGAFSFQDVSFVYPGGERQVLRSLSLEVEAGQTIAFVGESGSGKSTIMNLLIGFHRPQGGRILLDGVDMEELDLRDYRRRLSLVSQNIILFSGTIRDNVSYGRVEISDEQVRAALEAANAWNFVMDLPDGLDTLLGENGSRLSGGQRQRIAIARALIRDPRVIILDEATSALDVESERQVQAAIDRLIQGRTTFIVAHRLSTIRNADKVAVLKRGELVEFGSHDELLAREGEFRKLYKLYH
jgi:ATP-binding cassette subfamily B protein